MRGHLTEKADVFSFGVMALELVSGRPNSYSNMEEEKVYLLEWVCMFSSYTNNMVKFLYKLVLSSCIFLIF